MKTIRMVLSRSIASALLRHDMQQYGAISIFHSSENANHMLQIVSING